MRIALIFLLLAGCAGNITPTRQIEDAVLARQVREALAADATLKGQVITVNANSGRVTLLGVVATAAQRSRAAQVAAGVPGVTAVENLLTIR